MVLSTIKIIWVRLNIALYLSEIKKKKKKKKIINKKNLKHGVFFIINPVVTK